MNWHCRTLAGRMAAGCTLITCGAMAIGAIATWSLAWWSTLAGIDHQLIDLRGQMEKVMDQSDPPMIHEGGKTPHPPDLPGGILLRFRLHTGAVVWHSADFPADLPVPRVDQAPSTVTLDGRSFRCFFLNDHAHLPPEMLIRNDPQGLLMDCAIDLTREQESSCHLATLLGLLWFGSTVLAGLSSLALRRILIAPLASLTTQIAAVDAHQLGRRLDPDVPDELAPVVGRINDLLARLEQAFDREKETINTIAHELRTPVTIQRGTLEFAVLDGDRPISPQVAQRCLTAAIAMQRLIEDLLSLARLESGQETLRAEDIDLPLLVQRAWDLDQVRADARRLTLEVMPWSNKAETPTGPLLVVGTPGLSQSVVAGLIGNAIDHAPAGDHLQIAWSVTADRVAMTIVNRIASIPAGVPQTAAVKPHLGIGLPLCERILRVLGGTLEIVDADGRFHATATFVRRPSPCLPAAG